MNIQASQNVELAGFLQRVEEINTGLRDVADEQPIPLEVTALKPPFAQRALKESLTTDGVPLNATGQEIYRNALLQLLAAHS